MERSLDSIPASESDKLQCRICLRPFKRTGHLRRHERTHTAARPFPCSQCSRTFARRDALRRHEHSHLDVPNLVQQGSRACTSCASVKTRCSGGVPCKRCRDRGFGCVYPPRDFDSASQPQPVNEPASAGVLISTDSTLPEDVGNFPWLPDRPLDDFTTGPEHYPYRDWDDGFFHESNWLEASIGSEVTFSPLSSIFPYYSQVPGSLENETFSPLQNANGEEVQHVARDLSVRIEEDRTGVDLDSPVIDPPSGEYYVDDEPARLPRVRRRMEAAVTERHAQPSWSGTFSLDLPDTTDLANVGGRVEIAEVNYRMILDFYNRLCRFDGLFEVRFTDHELPSKPVFEALAALFCEKFNNVLPFLHWTTFASRDRNYLLDLSIVAIGSQFLGNASFSASLHEFTRRCLLFAPQDYGTAFEQEFSMAAASLLNIVGSAYCGHERLRQHALQARSQLKVHFERLRRQVGSSPGESSFDSLSKKWDAWVQRESSTRLAFSVWLVDTVLVTHYEATPTFRIESVTFPLPCADAVWQCKQVETWDTLYKAQLPNSTLMETLQKLYYNKSFSIIHTDFVRILTIHGLYHRLWEVERYYSGTLSHWEPLSTRQPGTAPFPKVSPWLPAVPAFRNWQNSSCDALDVLHWQANSTIGQMRGLEHPTVLHLHFARVVLLCPCYDILALARHLTSKNTAAASRDDVNKAMNMVRRWAVNHQYKARLAAIHAGVTFWHIRRHGIDAFYESPSLGLAALVLWAFSIFANRKSTPARSNSAPRESTEPAISSVTANADGADPVASEKAFNSSEGGDIILLDRPTDDELVQQFIRDGAGMRPFMSGVGEVFAVCAPPRILDKGIELLRHQECWGGSAEWTRLLQCLRTSGRLDPGSQ